MEFSFHVSMALPIRVLFRRANSDNNYLTKILRSNKLIGKKSQKKMLDETGCENERQRKYSLAKYPPEICIRQICTKKIFILGGPSSLLEGANWSLGEGIALLPPPLPRTYLAVHKISMIDEKHIGHFGFFKAKFDKSLWQTYLLPLLNHSNQ